MRRTEEGPHTTAGESSLYKFRICRCCLKEFASEATLLLHERVCEISPFAPVMFQNNAVLLYTVDGREPQNRALAKRLAVVGTLFLKDKFPLEDPHSFMFFALFMREEDSQVFCGFFSRDHARSSTLCLSCILVLPEYRGLKLGTFLAAVSFSLARREGCRAAPERPLSLDGQRLFAALWMRLVRSHFQQSSCSSVEECSQNIGVAVDDVLRALHSLHVVGVRIDRASHPMLFIDRSSETVADTIELLWP
jgi:GNAT superfamily N-acetyltransferase